MDVRTVAADAGTGRLNGRVRQLLTDWMGDDGWITRRCCSFRSFNCIGDVSRLSGEVTGKHPDGTVEVANQDGRDTAPGYATVALPPRVSGLPELPAPPSDWPQIQR